MKKWLLFPIILVLVGLLVPAWIYPSRSSVLGASRQSGNPVVRPEIEWFNHDEFAIYQGCGTECETVYVFNLKQGTKQKLSYGVNHTWSPDRQYVLAYHYAIEPGVSVGDRRGATLFDIRRPYTQKSPMLTSPIGTWSSDSSRLALVIKKANEEKLELLVFDVRDNFRLLSQRDLKVGRGEENSPAR